MGELARGFETNVGTGAVLTDGTTATSAASGGTQGTGTWTYAATAKYEGNLGLKVVTTAASANSTRFALAGTTSLQNSGCMAFIIDANPSATFTTYVSLRSSTGPSFRLTWKTNGTLAVRGQGTTTPETVLTGTYTAGTQYVVTWVCQAATSTTGSYTVNVYNGATHAKIGTATASTFDLGTTAFAAIDIGFANSDPQVGRTNQFDAIRVVDGGTTEIFPNSWSAPTQLAGQIYDTAGIVNGTLQSFDGTNQIQLATVAII